MKRFFLIITISILSSVAMFAQMSDSQVVSYVKEQVSMGKDQKTIAKELVSRGVSIDQLQRLQSKIQSKNGSSSASSKTGSDMDRSRVSNGEKREDMDDEDTDYGKTKIKSKNKSKSKNKDFDEEDEEEEEAKIKIFGHDIFRSKNLSFEPNMNIATPSTYVLGPGDEVVLDIYGASQLSNSFKISPDGTITIPNEGPVNVSGLTVAQAQAKVKRAIGGHYQGSNIAVTVGQTRTITVNVMGEVETPGTYTLSAFATVFNALYLAGGVNDIGTLRNVKVSRNGRIITTVDVYDYILNGKLTGNVSLRDNDVIIVGPYDNLVKVEGMVKRPMYYEMKKSESLQSLLKFTGGFTGDAFKEKVRIERKSTDGLTVHNVDEWDFTTFKMEDGDVAIVSGVIERYKNTVTVKGAVFRPGSYKIGGSVNSVKTLIEQAGGLLEQAFTARAVLHRMKADRSLQTMSINLKQIVDGNVPDVVLQNEDELVISSTKEIDDRRMVTIYGNVLRPGEYPYSQDETVEDLITEAGGLDEAASLVNVEVARRIVSAEDNPNGDKVAKVFSLTLNDGLVIDGKEGFKLMPYDIVTIHKNPDYQVQKYVNISGEVKYTGSYVLVNKKERVSDLVKRSGGVTKYAYTTGARLVRKYTEKDKELQKLKLDVAQSAADSIAIENKLKEDTYNVGIDLELALANPGSEHDVILAEGDSLYIPVCNNTVKISGEVLFPNTVSYIAKKPASYYLNQAGGINKDGKKSLAYIVYPNGQVSKASKGKVLPGCEIVVPQKPEKKIDTQQASLYVSLGTSIATVAAVLISALK